MNNFYGFTYKLNNNPNPTKADYEPVLKLLRSKGEITDFVYEDKTKAGKPTALHIHGVIDFNRKNPYFKKLIPKGFHAHFEQIYDSKHWIGYINKNNYNFGVSEALEKAGKQSEDELPTDSQLQDDSPLPTDYFRNHYVFGEDEIYLNS